MMISKEDIYEMTKLNRGKLELSRFAGCLTCMQIFRPVEILSFTDDSLTALCPCCNNPTLIPARREKFILYLFRKYIEK